MRKPLFFLYCALFLLCFILTMRYVMNEVSINNYVKGKYDNDINNFLLLINYPQPYVAHYNKGNNLYYAYDYDGAIAEYDEALKTTPKQLRCAVYNNQAQAMIKKLEPNSPYYESELEYIQKILTREGCAQENGGGSDQNSQEIYDALEDEKEQQQQGGEGEEEEPFDPQEYEGLEDELDKQQEETSKEREKGQQGKYNPYNPKW